MEVFASDQSYQSCFDFILNTDGMALLKTIKEIGNYFHEIYDGVASLVRGMKVTGKYFFNSSEIVTQQYPENRATLQMFDNFKGELILKHTEANEHFCDACNNCARKCPNGTIEVISRREVGPDGKQKRVLDQYIYHLDMCTFCGLCVQACEQDALAFSQEFEHAVFDRAKLTKQLNQPGSKVVEKTNSLAK
jgi:NADH-quinone oxidoreductase subunit I